MEVIINLIDCEHEEKVLLKFGETLVLGGPDGNISIDKSIEGKGWGLNWDALNDSLGLLEEGGIWKTSPKFKFPLKLLILNYESFKKNQSDKFRVLKEILEDQRKSYEKDGKVFEFEFK